MTESPEPKSDNYDGKRQMQELATRYGMTREEMELIVYDIQQKDLSLEWLKQPRAQQIVKHRKGRWVHEEEKFAAFLSKEFCLGLSEIDNGTTKRVYLSCKLVCTKMRISKKFKGKNSGKEVFTKRTAGPDGIEYSPLELTLFKQQHEELEAKFIKSVLKSEIKGCVKILRKKTSSPSPPHSEPQPTSHGKPLPDASSRGADNTISPMNGLVAQNVRLEILAPLQNKCGQLYHKNDASTGMNAPAVVSRSSSDGVPLQSISHQNAKSPGVYIRPAAGVTRSQAQACLSFLPYNAVEYQGCRQVPSFTDDNVLGERLDGLGFPSLLSFGIETRSTTASKAVSSTPSEASPTTTNLVSLNENTSYSNCISRHGGAEVYCRDNLMPDLLLGFDNYVATEDMTASFEARPIPKDSHFFAGAGCLGESPCITSKSFDELHRHLGIGLSSDKVSHLDLNHYQGSLDNFVVPRAHSVLKQGTLQPAAGAFVHIPDFAQFQPPKNAVHQYPS